MLIPAHFLVNGRSILQEIPQGTEDIEYFHIELETHEIIFAERARVETLLVKANIREAFNNFISYHGLYGSYAPVQMAIRAPICGYHGGRDRLKSMLRRAVSVFVDIRDPIQIAYDQIVSRAAAINNCLQTSADGKMSLDVNVPHLSRHVSISAGWTATLSQSGARSAQ
jgi:hypothetical protein